MWGERSHVAAQKHMFDVPHLPHYRKDRRHTWASVAEQSGAAKPFRGQYLQYTRATSLQPSHPVDMFGDFQARRHRRPATDAALMQTLTAGCSVVAGQGSQQHAHGRGVAAEHEAGQTESPRSASEPTALRSPAGDQRRPSAAALAAMAYAVRESTKRVAAAPSAYGSFGAPKVPKSRRLTPALHHCQTVYYESTSTMGLTSPQRVTQYTFGAK